MYVVHHRNVGTSLWQNLVYFHCLWPLTFYKLDMPLITLKNMYEKQIPFHVTWGILDTSQTSPLFLNIVKCLKVGFAVQYLGLWALSHIISLKPSWKGLWLKKELIKLAFVRWLKKVLFKLRTSQGKITLVHLNE